MMEQQNKKNVSSMCVCHYVMGGKGEKMERIFRMVNEKWMKIWKKLTVFFWPDHLIMYLEIVVMYEAVFEILSH